MSAAQKQTNNFCVVSMSQMDRLAGKHLYRDKYKLRVLLIIYSRQEQKETKQNVFFFYFQHLNSVVSSQAE